MIFLISGGGGISLFNIDLGRLLCSTRLLIVEDDSDISNMLQIYFPARVTKLM